MKWLVPVFLLGSLLTATAPGQTPGRILTPTKLVVTFSELENAWLGAIQKKDAAALDHLLQDEFEVWEADAAAPVPREEWQAKAFSVPLQAFEVRRMAARAIRDDVVLVSFSLTETRGMPNKTGATSFFVVDVWLKDGDKWKCSDRYVSRMANAGRAPAQPTGKD